MNFVKTLQLIGLVASASAKEKLKGFSVETGLLRASNQVSAKDYVECDWETEETCYDDYSNAVSCALIADGGCTCPEGEKKCGAGCGYAGFCTSVCCDSNTEETCYEDGYIPTSCAAFANGGCICPEGEEKCGGTDYYAGFCTADICCDNNTEETCYDEYYSPTSCAAIAEGGCTCPKGETKCGAEPEWGYAGTCTSVCCDANTEETCYDEYYSPTSCAAIAEGGCTCPKGETKCGAEPEWGYAGTCTLVCCDDSTEETCYDDCYSPTSCAAITEGGCPCPDGEDKCGGSDYYAGFCTADICCNDSTEETCYDDNWIPTSCALSGEVCPFGQKSHLLQGEFVSKFVHAKGTSKEASYFGNLNLQLNKQSANGSHLGKSANLAFKEMKLELYHAIKVRAESPSTLKSHDMKENSVANFIQAKGTPTEFAYFHGIKMQQKKLSSNDNHVLDSANIALHKKEMKLYHAIKLRVESPSSLNIHEVEDHEIARIIQTKANLKEVSYFYNIKMQQMKLSSGGDDFGKSAEVALKKKEAELYRIIKFRVENPFANDVVG